MSLLKIVFVFASLWFSYCYSYTTIKRYPNKVLNSKQNLLIKNTRIYNVPRAKTAISLFKDINMSNFFPGFKTIFNTKGNYVKSIFIFGSSCFTIFIITKLLLMLRRFFQNQYKMISEQEIELMGKYENPHIEFKD
ncbi:hypothetical protein PFHG_03199 [Plasmodium falciparum HB3]|uniref:Uncharacterized protein n=1 Tax=Plasmodium falciparum (isolate HB3) TaxID=137071 RepID=A0A0L7KEB5_PLAFX|nr:hypothetical protein PFHG_03199 [Plasmodium falciparum HB3]